MNGQHLTAAAVRRAVDEFRERSEPGLLFHGSASAQEVRTDFAAWDRVRTGFGGVVYHRSTVKYGNRYRWSWTPERNAP